MLIPKYVYTDTEIKTLLKSIILLIDTREQRNEHIINYLDKKKVKYKSKKLDYGDYGALLPANNELGIMRDIVYPVVIERKNSIDELASTIKDRTRFENELIRSQGSNFLLLVEDHEGYEKLIKGDYRSQYQARALLGSLKTFETRYRFNTVFVSKMATGNFIYHHLFYFVREMLKGGN